MPIEGVYSVEERRAFVYEYMLAPYGEKQKLLKTRGIRDDQLRRWKRAVLADTLDHGLVPWTEGRVDMDETSAVARLLQENAALREQIAARDAAHQRELEQRDEELGRQRRAVDALGKAIELLHPSGEAKSSEPEPAAAPTPDQTPNKDRKQGRNRSR
mgnify:FL=1